MPDSYNFGSMINNYLLLLAILLFLHKFKENFTGQPYPETGGSSGIEVKMFIGKSIILTLLPEMRLTLNLNYILWDLLVRSNKCWIHSSGIVLCPGLVLNLKQNNSKRFNEKYL
jgi:hypothetical protein